MTHLPRLVSSHLICVSTFFRSGQYISGIDSKYDGCRVELNGTVIASSFADGMCSVPSQSYRQYDDRLVIRLLKNTRPDAKISDVKDNLEYGDTLNWKVEATDADENLNSAGIYLHQGTPEIGVETDWTVLKWTGGAGNVSHDI